MLRCLLRRHYIMIQLLCVFLLAALCGCAAIERLLGFDTGLLPDYPGIVQGNHVVLVVESGIAWQISSALNTFETDLEEAGYRVSTENVAKTASPLQIRQLLQSYYDSQGLVGAFLIGDLPAAYFQWHGLDCTDPTYPIAVTNLHSTDMYYMDLTGEWTHLPGPDPFRGCPATACNGTPIAQYKIEPEWHTFQDEYIVTIDPDGEWEGKSLTPKTASSRAQYNIEIWVARIMGHNLSIPGKHEAQIIQDYLAKNHAYRSGAYTVADQAFILNGMENMGHDPNMEVDFSNLFGTVTKRYEVTQQQFRGYVERSEGSELIIAIAHSFPGGHGMHDGLLTTQELLDIDKRALFWLLPACSACRWDNYIHNPSSPNYLGGIYVFAKTHSQGDLTLGAVGVSGVGGVYNLDVFADYMNTHTSASYGEGFVHWYNREIESNFTVWNYVFLGDPTITPCYTPAQESGCEFLDDFGQTSSKWTEYDPSNKIDITDGTFGRLEFENWIRTDPGYVGRSCSRQDFALDFDIHISASGGNANAIGPGMGDGLGTRGEIMNGVFVCYYAGYPTVSPRLWITTLVDGIYEYSPGGNPPQPHAIDIEKGATYYVRLEKDEGNVTLAVYSNPARTIHVPGSPKTVSTALDDTGFSHIYAVNGHIHPPEGNWEWTTGWIDNIAIGDPTDEPPSPVDDPGILFVSDRDGNDEVYWMELDGTEQVRLTFHPDSDGHPVMGPSGERIAFQRLNSADDYDVYVMDRDGSAETRLTSSIASDHGRGNFRPVWSPDGSKIAYQGWHDSRNSIFTINPDGTAQTNLTGSTPYSDAVPVWSPDGEKILFGSLRESIDPNQLNEEIFVMNADGSGQTNLSNNPAWDGRKDWSPDGTRIAFDSNRGGDDSDIYVMDADGTNLTRLTDDPDDEGRPAWSPDGTRIAFRRRTDYNWEIIVMNADGSNQVNLTNSPAQDANFLWLSDGMTIAFESDRDGDWDIYTIKVDGSGLTNLTNNNAADSLSLW